MRRLRASPLLLMLFEPFDWQSMHVAREKQLIAANTYEWSTNIIMIGPGNPIKRLVYFVADFHVIHGVKHEHWLG